MIDAAAIAAALSAETDQPWGATMAHGTGHLSGPGGAELSLHERTQDARLIISGNYGPAYGWRPRHGGISRAMRSGVAAAATPIRSRSAADCCRATCRRSRRRGPRTSGTRRASPRRRPS